MDLDCAANCLDNAWEFRDDSVPGAAEDVTLVRRDRFIDHGAVHAQSGGGAFFVTLREMAAALHIGSEDRSKPTLHGGTRQKGTCVTLYERQISRQDD